MRTLNAKKNMQKDRKYLISVFLIAMITLNLILGTVIYFRYHGEVLEELKRIQTESYQADRFSREILKHKFQDMTKAMMSITHSLIVKEMIENGDNASFEMIADNLMRYLEYDDDIIEIALINRFDEAMIAVSKHDGNIACYYEDQMELSYYEDELEALKNSHNEGLYFSNLQLARTHNGGGAHLEPVIRFGMLIKGFQETKGYLIISYSGLQILNEIEHNNATPKLQNSIVIDNGQWMTNSILVGADVKASELRYKDFKRYFPTAWERIKDRKQTSFDTKSGNFTSQRFDIMEIFKELGIDAYTSSEKSGFYILSFISAARIHEIKVEALKELAFIPLTAFITVVIVSMILAFVMNQERRYRILLKYEAERDALTGLYNRREGLAILENMLHISKRQNHPLIIAYIDIDNLKEVNDTYGHNEGDSLIKKVAELIQLYHRESDVLTRVGGDEFILILPDCSQTDASLVFKRIEDSITAYNGKNERAYDIHLSYGLAHYDGGDIKLESLIQEADEAMYYVKEKKREKRNDDVKR